MLSEKGVSFKNIFTFIIFSLISLTAFSTQAKATDHIGYPDSINAVYNPITQRLDVSGTYKMGSCSDIDRVGFSLFMNGSNPLTLVNGSLDGNQSGSVHVLSPCTGNGTYTDSHTIEALPRFVCVVIYDVNEEDTSGDFGNISAGGDRNRKNSYENNNDRYNLNIKSGGLDINRDNDVNSEDEGPFNGFSIINGSIDIDENNIIDGSDDLNDSFFGFDVYDGKVDINNNGIINSGDGGQVPDPRVCMTPLLAVGNLTVIKQVVNDNDGELDASDFNLHVKNSSGADVSGSPAAGSESGTNYILEAGTYVVSEDPSEGYAQTFGGDCDENGNINVTINSSKTCTITNNDAATTILVNKTVINDNGGTLIESNFVLKINDNTVTDEAVNEVTPGEYTISEVAVSGYTGTIGGDCAADGTVTVTEGQAAVCTIHNDDQPGTLIVIKEVYNDEGGQALPEDFTMTVTGENPSPASFPGQNLSGTTVTLDAGDYTVSESGPSGYGGIASENCEGTIGIGELKECTITNNDLLGEIRGMKFEDENGNGVKDDGELGLEGWTIYLDLNNNGVLDDGEPSKITDSNGLYNFTNLTEGNYTIREVNQSDWVQTLPNEYKYELEVKNGDVIEDINFGNYKYASILVEKDVDFGDPESSYEFFVTLDGNDQRTITKATTVLYENLPPGTYIIEELPDANFNLYSYSYDEDAADGAQITVGSGDEISLIITNRIKFGNVTIYKKTIPAEEQEFSFLGDNFPEFSLANGGSKLFPNLIAGSYGGIFEAVPDGWISSSECSDGSSPSSIELGAGENMSCTFTNIKKAKLTITKIVNNDNGGTSVVDNFPLFVNESTVNSGDENLFVPGEYIVSETNQPGYSAAFSGDCDDNGNIVLEPGDVKTCTITNDDIAVQNSTLTVNKIVINDDGGKGAASDFNLFINESQVSNGGAVILPQGEYIVTESINVNYSSTFSGDCDSNGNVVLTTGENKTCNITNNDIAEGNATLKVTKIVINNDTGTAQVSDFELFVNQQSIISGQPLSLPAGEYAITESENELYAPSFSEDCDTNGNIVLNPGEIKYCTITNDDIPPILGQITGIKFNDSNGNGKRDEGENGLSDWRIFLDNNNNEVNDSGEPSTLTAADGTFSFTNLGPGTYNIYELLYSRWNSTFPKDQRHPAVIDGNSTYVEFGNVLVTSPCANTVKDVIATCKQGTIIQDIFSNSCRTLICSDGLNIMNVKGCDKPDNITKTLFEVYRQNAQGIPFQVCLGDACVGNNSNAQSSNFPICTNLTQQNQTQSKNVTSANLYVKQYYPKGRDYVIVCNATGFVPTSYDWFFSDGDKQLNSANKDVFHRFKAAGAYTVQCFAKTASISRNATLAINVI
ncbi:MAG TPA: SdrD B-like domain-containing protein [Candidatus Nanoarchaeia archaeon]|nr:SdrD B-like domain-containing protein [Candidatus Nanoarchaeia archaeon]